MNPATSAAVKRLDSEIRRMVDLRHKATARRQLLQVKRYNDAIRDLQRRRQRLLSQTRHAASIKPVTRKSRFSLRSLFERGADRPPPGVIDRYAGVEPSERNAAAMAAYYYARSKRRLISRRARAYFLLRLQQVKPFLPNKTGPGKLMEAARRKRQMASRAAARKAYGMSTSLLQQASTLEQQARSLELQEASGSRATPVLEPEPTDDIEPSGSATEKAAAETDDAEAAATVEGEKPWYMNPLVWAGGVVGLIVLAKAGGKGGKGSTSTTRKSYVVSSSGLRRSKSGGRLASTSLTRSL